MIIGLLLYKTGISANSQEVFFRAHGSLINPIERHPCCLVCIRNPISATKNPDSTWKTRLHKHPENITTKIMKANTTGGWKETTTRMSEQINETLHNTKNEYINPQKDTSDITWKKQAEEKQRYSFSEKIQTGRQANDQNTCTWKNWR